MTFTSFNQKATPSRVDVIFLIACLVIAISLRVVVILGQQSQLAVDRDAYLGIAASVADGRGYSSPNSTTPTAFRPPLYPLMLALQMRLVSPAIAVAVINLLTGILTVWLTAGLGKHLNLGRSCFAAALLVAIDPLLVQYAARPMTESLCTFLATLWLWFTISKPSDEIGTVQPSFRFKPFFSGVIFGLLVLSRPTFWLIAGFCIVNWLIAVQRQFTAKSDRPSFWNGIWASIGTLVTVAPWVIRNAIVMGAPILTTTHGGYTLLLGNNPVFYDQVVKQPWGTAWPGKSQKEWVASIELQMSEALGPQATETERDVWQSGRAKAYILSEPQKSGEAMLHRIRSLWNTTPQGEATGGVNRTVIITVSTFYLIVLVAGFIGMTRVLTRSDRAAWLPLYILIASVQIVHLFYWTNTRMRSPLTPAIALFAVAAVTRPVRHHPSH